MATEYTGTDPHTFRDARFTAVDLTGATFRDCDFRHVKVVDSWLTDVNFSGLIEHFFVNDVDVAPLVEAELDRRNPERVQLRAMESADDFRAMWATLEQLWSDTVARACKLPESMLQERVDDEWSFVETLRHLVFATDAWAFRTVLDEPMPFDRLGLTHTAYPRQDAIALGIESDARPTLDEVLELRAGRVARVHAIVENLDAAELDRTCRRPPAPGYPDEPRTVGRCLRVVMDEECEHRRYANRDLVVLEARHGGIQRA
jgi:hypothetical protein